MIWAGNQMMQINTECWEFIWCHLQNKCNPFASVTLPSKMKISIEYLFYFLQIYFSIVLFLVQKREKSSFGSIARLGRYWLKFLKFSVIAHTEFNNKFQYSFPFFIAYAYNNIFFFNLFLKTCQSTGQAPFLILQETGSGFIKTCAPNALSLKAGQDSVTCLETVWIMLVVHE